MNIIEALKIAESERLERVRTGAMVKRQIGGEGSWLFLERYNGRDGDITRICYKDAQGFFPSFSLTVQDILAEDWEVARQEGARG